MCGSRDLRTVRAGGRELGSHSNPCEGSRGQQRQHGRCAEWQGMVDREQPAGGEEAYDQERASAPALSHCGGSNCQDPPERSRQVEEPDHRLGEAVPPVILDERCPGGIGAGDGDQRPGSKPDHRVEGTARDREYREAGSRYVPEDHGSLDVGQAAERQSSAICSSVQESTGGCPDRPCPRRSTYTSCACSASGSSPDLS